METINIPNKSLFKPNEVSGLTGVKPYVLRFWETEFEDINPMISSTGEKLYEKGDIEAVALVKNLLFEKKLTIDQAKAALKVQSLSLFNESEEVESTEEDNQEVVSHSVAGEVELEETFDELIEERIEKKEEVTTTQDNLYVKPQTPYIEKLEALELERVTIAKAKFKSIIAHADELFERHGW